MPATEGRRKGGRRKLHPDLRDFNIVMGASDVATLDEIAQEEGRTRSDLVREAVRKYWLKGRRAATSQN